MKEDWLDQIVNDLDKLPKAQPGEDFVQSLLGKVDEQKNRVVHLRRRNVWLAAASIALVITANVLLIGSEQKNEARSENQQQYDEYGFESFDNPYNLSYDE